jgi:hypothetical protein
MKVERNHVAQIPDLSSSQNIITVIKPKVTKMGAACDTERCQIRRIFIGKLEGTELLGRSIRRWDDNRHY